MAVEQKFHLQRNNQQMLQFFSREYGWMNCPFEMTPIWLASYHLHRPKFSPEMEFRVCVDHVFYLTRKGKRVHYMTPNSIIQCLRNWRC